MKQSTRLATLFTCITITLARPIAFSVTTGFLPPTTISTRRVVLNTKIEPSPSSHPKQMSSGTSKILQLLDDFPLVRRGKRKLCASPLRRREGPVLGDVLNAEQNKQKTGRPNRVHI
jgi:hypothetical protein